MIENVTKIKYIYICISSYVFGKDDKKKNFKKWNNKKCYLNKFAFISLLRQEIIENVVNFLKEKIIIKRGKIVK